jgi:acetoin utilization protein AcuC
VFKLGGKVAFIYSDEFLNYEFGPSHPFKSLRLKLTLELMRALNVLDSRGVKATEPAAASLEDILLFHTEDYVKTVRYFSQIGYGTLDRGDTPAFKGCYDVARLIVGGSIKAVDLVMSGKANHAFNIGGGLHHAHPDRASGFCIFNDPAIAVAYLKQKYNLKRIMYLDVDAHHGDGVMYGFYSDPSLLDIDFHENGRHLFPGTGFPEETGEGPGKGYKVNVPLPPHTRDEAFLYAFNEIVPPLAQAYRPEIILLQCGVDSHFDDPLTHLELTTRAYSVVASRIHAMAHEICDGRLVLFGGGGYNVRNVARCWTIVLGEISEIKLPNQIPLEWMELFRKTVKDEPPTQLYDQEMEIQEGQSRRIMEEVKQTVSDVKRRIPMTLGAG